MEFRVAVYEDTNVVGAEVNVISGETVVDSISIVDAQDFDDLNTQISTIINDYCSKTELTTVLSNTDLGNTINATKFDGHESSYYAVATHTHQYAPLNHAESTGQYGTGSDTNYGHVKTINGLTDSSYLSGRALSAYQGKILNDNKMDKAYTTTRYQYGSDWDACDLTFYKYDSFVIVVGWWKSSLRTIGQYYDLGSIDDSLIPADRSVYFDGMDAERPEKGRLRINSAGKIGVCASGSMQNYCTFTYPI